MISVWETHGRSQENFEQVSDCLSKKIFCDPAERLVLGQKYQIIKNVQYMPKIDINTWNMAQIPWFSCFDDFSVRDSLEISRKLLTSLKLFVEKKYLRSRRATRAWTKTHDPPKTFNICLKLTQTLEIKLEFFDFCVLMISVWETHWRSQENFWQVSNYLSRKNIWDPAENLLLGQKYQNPKKFNICQQFA